MYNNKVVITGGPSSGKTTLINALKKRRYTCFDEVSRELIKKAKQKGIDQPFLEDPKQFNTKLVEARKLQFEEAQQCKELVFFDRGIHDVIGYMKYGKQDIPLSFEQVCKEVHYDYIFILPPWSAIHTQDSERYETFEQAKQVYNCLYNTYKDYNYTIVTVPKTSIEDRLHFILEKLKH